MPVFPGVSFWTFPAISGNSETFSKNGSNAAVASLGTTLRGGGGCRLIGGECTLGGVSVAYDFWKRMCGAGAGCRRWGYIHPLLPPSRFYRSARREILIRANFGNRGPNERVIFSRTFILSMFLTHTRCLVSVFAKRPPAAARTMSGTPISRPLL